MPSLSWLGKDKVLNHHLEVPFRTLKRVSSFGDIEAASRNKIIHGDNLLALKSLLPEFEGRIRCIYIDPPYNTGNEAWTYNDNVSDPRMLRWLGQVVGREGEDLTRHDKWLCMMYPRLKQNKSDGGNRSFILVEMEDYADSLTAERMRRVISGKAAASESMESLRSGFDYLELGAELFAEDGSLNWAVGKNAISAYVWHTETGTGLPKADGKNQSFLGTHLGVSYYLFAEEGKTTVLDYSLLQSIDRSSSSFVIYSDACALSAEFLLRHSITFKKIPRDIARF